MVLLKYDFLFIIEKIKIFKKDILISLIISLIFIIVFFLTILKSNNDYSIRLGVFPIDIEKKNLVIKVLFITII